jgi:hypothetical protein
LNHLDPQTTRLVLGLIAMTVMLALTALATHAANRFLGPNHPRKAIVSRLILWGATALLIGILLLIRRE